MRSAETTKTSAAVAVKPQSQQPFFTPGEQHEEQDNGLFFGVQQPGGAAFFQPKLQAKLSVGQPGDKYEREADTMAEQVVQKLASSDAGARVQRKCAECAREDEQKDIAPKLQMKSIFESNEEPANEQVQRKCEACNSEHAQPILIQRMEGGEEPELQAKQETPSLLTPASLESRLNSTKGGGSLLPDDTRTSMESSFGADFSGVRVHTNSGAVQMNQELGAQAFTHGSDIYFNSGKYRPGTSGGQRLLAHELTHTIQQTQNSIQPSLQLSRLLDFRARVGYEPTDSEIEATNEYLAYTNEQYVWQTELNLSAEEARLACRLILAAMHRGEVINWRQRAREFAMAARQRLPGTSSPAGDSPAGGGNSNSFTFRRRLMARWFTLSPGNSLTASIRAMRNPEGCVMPNTFTVYLYNVSQNKYETTVNYPVDDTAEYTWRGLVGGIYQFIFIINGNIAEGCNLTGTINVRQESAKNNIVPTARRYVGSTAWAIGANKPPYGPGTNKCNLFVFETLNEAGAAVQMVERTLWGIISRDKHPPLAGQWADPGFSISGWSVVPTPEVGDVIAESHQYSDASGHVGIVSSVSNDGATGTTISAATSGSVVENDWGFRSGQNVVFRRYAGRK